MASAPLGTVLGHVRQLATAPATQKLPDGQLLERFADRHEQAAFAELVRRHGRLVWGVCRHVLQHDQDAEDAFQATFLALAHKAGALGKLRALAGWLHEAAFRSAMQIKRQAARRRVHEQQASLMPERKSHDELAWRELQAVLDEEIQRLPEKYRAPFVLCCLEGKSKAEAAKDLGWKEGTVSWRLAEARKQLQRRLARRGVSLSAGLCAGVLTQEASGAAVPASLMAATVRAAWQVAAGEAVASEVVSAKVAETLKAVTRTAFMTQSKVATALVLALAIVASGAGLILSQSSAAPAPDENRIQQHERASRPAELPNADEAKSARLDRYGDPLPAEAISRLGSVRFRHGSLITSLAFTADGKQLISHDHDALRTWDAATGRELGHVNTDPDDGIIAAFVPRDGKTVITMERVRGAKSIRVRNRADLTVVREFDVGDLQTPRWSPDGKLLFGLQPPLPDGKPLVGSLTANSTLETWDMAEGKRLRSWKAQGVDISDYEFSADGKTLVTGGHDKAILFWDVATGQLQNQITGHPKGVGKLALSADGRLLATLGETGEPYFPWENVIRISDAATGKERRQIAMPVMKRFRDYGLGFNNLAFSPDGKTLVTTGQDDVLRFWDPHTGKELRQISLGNRTYMGNRAAATLSFAPDGKTLAVGTNAIWLLDVESGKDVRTIGSHRGGIYATATSDGQTAYTAGDEGIVVIWDLATGRERGRLAGYDQRITSIAILDAGRRLLTSGVHLWDLTTKKELRYIHAPYANGARAPLALSPDERTLAVPAKDMSVALIDLETGKELASFGKHDLYISGAAFHPDGRTLIVWCQDHTAHVWDLKTGRQLRQFEFAELQPFHVDGQPIRPPPPPSGKGGRNGYGYAVAVSPDGRLIAYGSYWHYLAIHDVLTGKTVRVIDKLLPDGAGTLAFSPDGRTLAWSGWQQPAIHLLESATGKERHRFEGHKRRVTSLAFSADGRTLISGSEDTTALVWDLAGTQSLKKGPLDSDTAWRDLAGADPATAYQAMRRLAATSTEAILFLRKHLPAAPVPGEKRLAELIADLDNEQFAVREKAVKDLEKFGEAAVRACEKALQGQPSAEARRRLESFLKKEAKSASEPSPERLRALRVIELLERIGTLPAQELLKSLASGAPQARLTQEAKAALERLATQQVHP
jgi:RNA polymerase sigma factor (sigma-70 family)